jgi:hypothetical protein
MASRSGRESSRSSFARDGPSTEDQGRELNACVKATTKNTLGKSKSAHVLPATILALPAVGVRVKYKKLDAEKHRIGSNAGQDMCRSSSACDGEIGRKSPPPLLLPKIRRSAVETECDTADHSQNPTHVGAGCPSHGQSTMMSSGQQRLRRKLKNVLQSRKLLMKVGEAMVAGGLPGLGQMMSNLNIARGSPERHPWESTPWVPGSAVAGLFSPVSSIPGPCACM